MNAINNDIAKLAAELTEAFETAGCLHGFAQLFEHLPRLHQIAITFAGLDAQYPANPRVHLLARAACRLELSLICVFN